MHRVLLYLVRSVAFQKIKRALELSCRESVGYKPFMAVFHVVVIVYE